MMHVTEENKEIYRLYGSFALLQSIAEAGEMQAPAG